MAGWERSARARDCDRARTVLPQAARALPVELAKRRVRLMCEEPGLRMSAQRIRRVVIGYSSSGDQPAFEKRVGAGIGRVSVGLSEVAAKVDAGHLSPTV